MFGAGNDLQIYHSGSHSIIKDAGTGHLVLQANDLRINNADWSANYISATNGDSVDLFFNNSKKLATTSTGIDVTGTATMDGLTVVGSGSKIRYDVASSNPHTNPTLHLENQNTTDGNVASLMLSADNANGVSGSAYIYAQSETSNQKGNLVFAREDGANNPVTSMKLSSNGDISFYEDTGTTAKLTWDASAELLTTTGLDVIGTATMDGLTVDGDAKISDTLPRFILNETDATDLNTAFRNNGGVLKVQTVNDAGNSFTSRLDVDHSTGDISFYEDTGTTPKMVWDASAESLGIGITNPTQKLHIDGGTGNAIARLQGDATLRLDFGTSSDPDAGRVDI